MARKKKTEIQKQKEEILAFLKKDSDRPATFSDLLNAFDIYDKDNKTFFRLILEELVDTGKIIEVGRQKFALNKGEAAELLEGIVDHVNAKFAFVRYEEGQKDIYVDASRLNGALDGDKVKVRILPGKKRKGDNPEGKIVEVLERGKSTWVGKVKLYPNYGILQPTSKNIHEELFIAKQNLLHAENGDLVIAKILHFPTELQQGSGQIIEVLGKTGENNAEMHAIMAEFGLPVKFSEEVLKEAEAIPEDIDYSNRRDFREVLTFTIDPHDAKDFDDALSYRKLDNGNVEIGIHIADVTHFVKEGSLLEKEAKYRATSVYLVDRTIPMLPERLSNGLCSLRPQEEKAVFSAVFELDSNATLVKEWFGRGVIFSDRRFAYEEAQEILEGLEEVTYAPILLEMNILAKKLRAERFKKGAFNFESPEVKFQLDAKGVPIGLYQKVRKDAHKLIEEFMLLANKRVAEFIFFGKFDQKVAERVAKNPEASPTMVYRIHEPPNPERVENFAKFASKLGFKVNTANQEVLSTSLNNLVKEIDGSPLQNVIESLAVRTMSKARYATIPLGHFGLAFEHYSHFTSPIRRYPDMMAHRLLQHYLDKKSTPNADSLKEACEHSSNQEKLAAEAERASIKYKQVEFMQLQDPATVYKGMVTGVTDFGIFVEMEGTACEGMVRLGDLLDDFYEYDPENYRVIGQRTGRTITFGDVVKVSVKGTDLERRSIDLNLEELGGKVLRRGTSPNQQARRKRRDSKVIPKGRRGRR